MPTSSGNVWFRPSKLTVRPEIVPVKPATLMFEGYGVAAPVVGIEIEVVLLKVIVLAEASATASKPVARILDMVPPKLVLGL